MAAPDGKIDDPVKKSKLVMRKNPQTSGAKLAESHAAP